MIWPDAPHVNVLTLNTTHTTTVGNEEARSSVMIWPDAPHVNVLTLNTQLTQQQWGTRRLGAR
jgi:K+-transporting ATPase c subunit